MLPGLASAASIRSAMLVAANDGCATKIIGELTMLVIGSKSVTGSKASFLTVEGSIAWFVMLCTISV